MNGRQVWMLSHLYNTHEQKPEWLDAARLGAEFMREHAFREDGKMHFRLTREGQSRSEVLSVYTEVFGAIAMAEYARAEPLFKRSLAISEKALGPDHPYVATSLENLAKLYRSTNRDAEARPLEERAARIRAMKR